MADFKNPKTATVKMKVDTDANGNIAQYSDTPAGTKYISIKGISSTCDLADAEKVFNVFIGDSLGGGTFDNYSAIRTITQEVG